MQCEHITLELMQMHYTFSDVFTMNTSFKIVIHLLLTLNIAEWIERLPKMLNSSRVKPMTLKLVFTTFLFDVQH